MTPEKSVPRNWRGQKERYSLIGVKMELPNPGSVVIFQGVPFHLEAEGTILRAFSDEERLLFNLNHRVMKE